MDITHCVIGSGPAGVACAKALLARGAHVLMLDAGLELEADRAQTIQSLAGKDPAQLTPEDLLTLKGNSSPTAKGLPRKLIFGSDFPYRDTEKEIPWRAREVGLEPSLALGGFSNVWGSAMLPYRDADMAGWPVRNAELASHYRAVTAFTGLAAQVDDLAENFPLYCDQPRALRPSRQADRFLKKLSRQREPLGRAGWRFGSSRLAVRAADSALGAGCKLCGLCMSGCPYGCIFNAADTVREMQAHPNFTYRRNAIVTSLRESATQVTIHGYDRTTRTPILLGAKRVYLAAGVIPTAQILLRSQDAYDQALRVRDSQYFLFPLLLARRTARVQTESLYTLSQMFMELNDPAVSAHTVHLQLYTYSDIISQAVRQSLGPLGFLAPALVERMIIFQGYLHSDESASIEMTLKRDGEKDFLQLDARPNPETRPRVKRLLRALLRQSHRLGGMVVPPMLQMSQPGRGFHSGGSLPMRVQPGKFESDLLGRPQGWGRVHAVDASVLPSIPATTITFSVMANAHRIGWETAAL
jgi:choline dehydrogenase-like flavoprotein